MPKKLLIILFTVSGLHSQAKIDIDSLYEQARQTQDVELGKKVYIQAIESNNTALAANTLYLIGWLYRQQNDHQQAATYYMRASALYQDVKDETLLANVYDDMGTLFYHVLHYRNAIHLYDKALKIREHNEDSERYAETLFNMGVAYRKLQQYDSALIYYRQAEAVCKESSYLLNHIYNDMGAIMEMTGSIALARQFYNVVLKKSEKEPNLFWKSRALHNLGAVALKQDPSEEAMTFYYDALALRKEMDDPQLVMASLNSLGHAHYELGEYEKSRALFEKAMDYKDQTENVELLMDTYLSLSRLEEDMGHAEKALSYSREFEQTSIAVKETGEELSKQLLFLEGELMLQQLEQFEREQILFRQYLQWFILAAAIILLTSIVTVRLYRIAQSRKATLQLIIKDLRSD